MGQHGSQKESGSADMKMKAEQKGLRIYELIVNEQTKLE